MDVENVEQEILDADKFQQHIDISIRRCQEVELQLQTSLPKELVSEYAYFRTIQNATASISHRMNHNTN